MYSATNLNAEQKVLWLNIAMDHMLGVAVLIRVKGGRKKGLEGEN
jgi:hypothetical protein